MFKSKILNYTKRSDYLQTRVRNPRLVMPNFSLYCDWIIWNRDHIYADNSTIPKTIYVRSEINALNYFIDEILKKIKNNFVLVTTSHDLTMPLGFHNKYNLDWTKIVNNKYLKAWITENRDLEHHKIKPIPLGLPCPDLPSWVLGAGPRTVWNEVLFEQTRLTRNTEKKLKIFGCWYSREDHVSGTCPAGNNERQMAYDCLIGQNEIFDWYSPGLNRMEFLRLMARYEFVLCPHGGGLDPNPKCWEALLVKSIPIVKRNTMTESLEQLPIVLVDDWSEITPGKLSEWEKRYNSRLYDDELEYLMSNSYYFNKALSYL